MSNKESCPHNSVSRLVGLGIDKWICDGCKAEFYHLENLSSGQIQVLEPYVTLRDQLAMTALNGRLAAGWVPQDTKLEDAAKYMYRMADAMLEARK